MRMKRLGVVVFLLFASPVLTTAPHAEAGGEGAIPIWGARSQDLSGMPQLREYQ